MYNVPKVVPNTLADPSFSSHGSGVGEPKDSVPEWMRSSTVEEALATGHLAFKRNFSKQQDPHEGNIGDNSATIMASTWGMLVGMKPMSSTVVVWLVSNVDLVLKDNIDV